MSVTILVGNGLSIAYNLDLSIPALTVELLHRFDAAGGELAAIADEANEGNGAGFEELLGPFDAVSAMIRSLPGLDTAHGSVPQFETLRHALHASRDIHNRGTGLALDLIAERSQIEGDFGPVDTFCSAVAELDQPASINIATLNYDGLVTAGFLQEGIYAGWTVHQTLDISDMGDGRTELESVTDFGDEEPLRNWSLRRVPDFVSGRARLLNLHGSLGWLRHRDDPDEVRRFRIPDLRNVGYWAKHSRGETSWDPVVVLTNRKTELSEEWPFVLCYSEFTRALGEADRWLVAGYGLGDDSVNRSFQSATRLRQRRDLESRVLVIDVGHPALIRHRTSERLGIPTEWITASGSGLPEAIGEEEWEDWA